MSWEVASFVVLGVALALGFAWYERSRPPARVLALVAALAALAVVGRLAFAAFPNVKPTTDIVLFAGYALGGAPGFAVGSITALVSNVFLSHGPWTPWQMAAWGGVGLAGGALGAVVRWRAAGRELGRWSLALACGLAGLGFGIVMDLYLWTMSGAHTLASYLVLAGRSLPFNAAHMAGNVVFALAIGPPLVRALRRYRRRFEVSWTERLGPSAGRTTAVALILAIGAMLLGGVSVAAADSTTRGAARYLLGAQNADGGFGVAPGQRSSLLFTEWAALGLAAAGHNPLDVARGRQSAVDYIRRHLGSVRDANDLARTILVLRAADLDPSRFGGRNLQKELRDQRGPDGAFGDTNYIDWTTFGILALRAAGETPDSLRSSAQWLEDQQNPDDGGFGSRPRWESDVDDTGAALQALVAAGKGDGQAVRRAVEYLERAAHSAGGFGFRPDAPRDAQSTAYAVQGLLAAGEGGRAVTRKAVAYLRSLRAADGHIRKSHTSNASPVWVTGQALPPLTGKPYPLDPVPRAAPPRPPSPDQDKGDGSPPRGESGRASEGSDPARKAAPSRREDGAKEAGTEGLPEDGGLDGRRVGASDGSAENPVDKDTAAGGAELTRTASEPGLGEGTLPRLQSNPSSHRPNGSAALDAVTRTADAFRAFSDAGPMPLARATAQRALEPGKGGREGPGGLAALVIATLSVTLVAVIAAAARLRRLWFTPRLQRLWDGLRRRPSA